MSSNSRTTPPLDEWEMMEVRHKYIVEYTPAIRTQRDTLTAILQNRIDRLAQSRVKNTELSALHLRMRSMIEEADDLINRAQQIRADTQKMLNLVVDRETVSPRDLSHGDYQVNI